MPSWKYVCCVHMAAPCSLLLIGGHHSKKRSWRTNPCSPYSMYMRSVDPGLKQSAGDRQLLLVLPVEFVQALMGFTACSTTVFHANAGSPLNCQAIVINSAVLEKYLSLSVKKGTWWDDQGNKNPVAALLVLALTLVLVFLLPLPFLPPPPFLFTNGLLF